jgi:hypothetical protein
LKELRTIRVRIVVQVNDRGQWCAAGYHGMTDKSQIEVVQDWYTHEGPLATNEVIHFVEADVPVPVSLVVEGQVVRE